MQNGADIDKQSQVEDNRRDLARLIDYYRLVVDSFENERLKNYDLFQKVKISNEDIHKVDWEIKRRKDELMELEQALNESNRILNNERKKAVHYGQVIENCKTIAIEDKRRIKQLLELSEPIEQTIKLYQNKEPVKTEKYSNFNFEDALSSGEFANNNPDNISITNAIKSKPKKSTSKNKPKRPVSSHYGPNYNPFAKKPEPPTIYRVPPSDEKQKILRTVLFPENEKIEELEVKNLEIKKEIEVMKQLYEDKLKQIEENRLMKEEKFRQQCIAYKKKTDDLIKENQKLEKLNFATAKDFLELKYSNGIDEQKKYEELEKLKIENLNLENQLKNAIKKTTLDKTKALKDHNQKTREISKNLGSQIRNEDQKANIIRSQYNELQKQYDPLIKDLIAKSKALINKCKFLENRKLTEYYGYINEIELMKKRIKSFQNYAFKLNKITTAQEDMNNQKEGENENGSEAKQSEQNNEQIDDHENNNNDNNDNNNN